MNALSVELVIDARNDVGEGPSWDASTQTLLWVDIPRKEVHRYSVADATHDVWSLDETVSAIVPRRSGGYGLTLESRIAVTDGWQGELGTVASIDHGDACCRMNDAKCDTQGRLWAGSMAWDGKPGAGSLYRCDLDGSIERVVTDVTISNGLGWSPDDERMYYVDTGRHSIDAFRFDPESGSIESRETIVEIAEEQGLPDGLAVDAEGCIWLAMWGSGAVHRYSPDGELLEVVSLPATQVSSCAFGGPDLRDLYVTSAASGLRQETDRDLEGGLFKVRVATAGLPTNPFGC